MIMSKVFTSVSLVGLLILGLISLVKPSSAQAPIVLTCGQTIESIFTENNQIHHYIVTAQADMALILYAETKTGNYENLDIDIGLRAPNGFEIERLDIRYQGGVTNTVTTDWLSVDGRYEIDVQGRTDTGGAYALTISCIYQDGTVVSVTNMVQSLQCGSIIENMISRDSEIHRYFIVLNRDDQVKFVATSLAGNYEVLRLDMGLWAPNGYEIERLDLRYQGDTTNTIDSSAVSNTGVYPLRLQGGTSTNGNYELSVTCTLANGNVVNPGDVPPVNLSVPDVQVSPVSATETFSGFGFPGIAPVDFANVAKLPIPAGIPMSGAVTPTGNEILGYQFDAEAGDIVEITFNRLSGNLNLGLVVIDSESNVIYQASLVTTLSMTSRFTVPASGQYTAGVFRTSLLPPSVPEPTAFQVVATVNP